jgi:uncharacterized damage-inducible protein DinB
MYAAADLLDLHTRIQRNLTALLEHCRGLSDAQLNTAVADFGFPSVAGQLFHLIGTEAWAMGYLRGEAEVPRDRQDYNTVDQLATLRAEVAALTADYLRGVSDEVLNRRAPYELDPGEFHERVPALVFIGLLAHHYHHQGQVLAMCRHLGHPRADETPVDFPQD